MIDNLNVNKTNLNIKRLSRLQGVILKVLATAYPGGFPKRGLSQIVGPLYSNQSCITWNEKKTQADKLFSMSDLKSQFKALELETQVTNAITLGRYIWLTPKFSVSYSRTIKSLLNQGLIADSGGGIFITEKGLAKIEGKKVKVTKAWDDFQAALREGKT